jgi:hypothetical protein
MNPPDVTTLLNMSESESLDFKDGQYKFWSPATVDEKSELLKDILAFANSFKTGDAFIVIGVSEKNQRKDQVTGVATHLKDNEVQQFVNSKTNRRVTFLVHSTTAEGQPIDIIQIAQKQERPICLTSDYGKMKANVAWIRSGSSSTVATPDQIAAMVKIDQSALQAEVRIALEWADPKNRNHIGLETSITSTRLIDSPASQPSPPEPAPGPRPLSAFLWPDDGTYTEELIKYVKADALLKPIRIWLKNLGARNVSNVNVRLVIKRAEDLFVLDEGDIPQKPRRRSLLATVNLPVTPSFDTHIAEEPGEWIIDITARAIQPQDEYWSDCFFIATVSDRTIDVLATIFADDLAKPVEASLKIYATVVERELTPADLGLENESDEGTEN